MRHYEIFFIVSPDNSDEDLKAVATKFQGVITGMDGVVTSYDEQGKKRLAYNVKKENKGYYVLMDFVGSADIVAEVERNMRLDDRVLKYLTLKLADQVDPESVEPIKPAPEEQPKVAEVPKPKEAKTPAVPKPEEVKTPEPEVAEVPKPKEAKTPEAPEPEEAKTPEPEVAEALEPEEAESPEVQESKESEKKES